MNELDLMKKQMDMQQDAQSNLQREASDVQGRLVAPQLKEQLVEAQAAVIAQTNPAKALKIVLEGFRGNIVNEYGDLETIGEPIMNKKGIARVATMLIPFVNDPVRFGNISHKEVRELALQVVNDITEDIGIGWRDYGIKNPSVKDLVIDACLCLIFITLTRSEEGDEKRFLSRVILESLGQKHAPKKESEGWLSKLKL